jgi:hypothetical protein
MEVESEKFRSYLSIVVNNKNMSFNRMTQNFTWAFGIFTAIIIVLIKIESFQSSILSWFLLNLSLYFWTIFFVRSCKEYVNQIRFVGLEKSCLSFLFNIEVTNRSIINENELTGKIHEYHLDWYSPIHRNKVILKVLFAHGFLALLIPIVYLWVSVFVVISKNNILMFLLMILPLMGVVHCKRSFDKRYFKCRVEEETMKGLE